ncbi:MAG: serine/threonine protein kinase [Ruminococcaceae bacterium]|nr:serine/threonine protein kinase [Oscillospiraceae bacterium]
MELNNEQVIYSSEKCKITKGEYNGKQCIKKTGGFSREAVNAIARINSPYIPLIYEVGKDYIIAEYTDGIDLSAAKISPKNVYEIALELCVALEEFHKNNVIHRDIKPSNIILGNDGHIKLIDFDAARIKKATVDKDTVFIGTDGFAPPEQFGFAQTDERSDIYALGTTLKLLLGEDYAHCTYKSVIEKCTRFDPERRYRTIGAVRSALVRSRYLRFAVPAAAVLGLSAVISVIFAFSNPSGITSDTARLPENSVQDGIGKPESDEQDSISEPTSNASTSDSTVSFPDTREITWDMLALPNDFPRLADAVTDYSVSASESFETNKIYNLRYIISWQKMSDAEFDEIKEKIKSWLGTTDDGTYSEDNIFQEYAFSVGGYDVSLQKILTQKMLPHIFGDSDEFFQGYIEIEEHGDDLKLPSFNCTFADPSAEELGDRPLRWEDTVINGKIPKLSDNVTEAVEVSDNGYAVTWNKMSIGELGCVLRDITDFLGTSQCEQNFMPIRYMTWKFPGGRYRVHVDCNSYSDGIFYNVHLYVPRET